MRNLVLSLFFTMLVSAEIKPCKEIKTALSCLPKEIQEQNRPFTTNVFLLPLRADTVNKSVSQHSLQPRAKANVTEDSKLFISQKLENQNEDCWEKRVISTDITSLCANQRKGLPDFHIDLWQCASNWTPVEQNICFYQERFSNNVLTLVLNVDVTCHIKTSNFTKTNHMNDIFCSFLPADLNYIPKNNKSGCTIKANENANDTNSENTVLLAVLSVSLLLNVIYLTVVAMTKCKLYFCKGVEEEPDVADVWL